MFKIIFTTFLLVSSMVVSATATSYVPGTFVKPDPPPLWEHAVYLVDLRVVLQEYIVARCEHGVCAEGYVIVPGKDMSQPLQWSPSFFEEELTESQLRTLSTYLEPYTLHGVYMFMPFPADQILRYDESNLDFMGGPKSASYYSYGPNNLYTYRTVRITEDPSAVSYAAIRGDIQTKLYEQKTIIDQESKTYSKRMERIKFLRNMYQMLMIPLFVGGLIGLFRLLATIFPFGRPISKTVLVLSLLGILLCAAYWFVAQTCLLWIGCFAM